MKEEGQTNPSLCIPQKEANKNLCIFGDGAKQSEDKSWSIAIYKRGVVREMRS